MFRPLVALFVFCTAVVFADKEETRVLFLGDSITYGGNWVVSVESAIRAQKGLARATVVNMALSSETTSGLSEAGHAGGSFPRPDLHERLQRALTQFKPTLVVACYGINDGIYQPLDPQRFAAYRDGIIRLRLACIKAGAKIVVMTPPLYSPDNRPKDAINYNGVMDAYAAWLVEQKAAGWQVIDIRPKLRDAVAAAKQADPKFIYAKDNLHPGDEGHLFIAQAVWPELAKYMKWKPVTPFAEGAKFKILQQSMTVLRNAWLTQVGHKRPGVAVGMPLDEAEARSAAFLTEYLK